MRKIFYVNTNGDLVSKEAPVGSYSESNLNVPKELSANIQATSSTTQALGINFGIDSTIQANASVTSDLTNITVQLQSSIQAQASTQQSLDCDKELTSQITTQSSVQQSQLDIVSNINSQIDCSSSVSGDIILDIGLQGASYGDPAPSIYQGQPYGYDPIWGKQVWYYSLSSDTSGRHLIVGKLDNEDQILLSHNGGRGWEEPPTKPPVDPSDDKAFGSIYNKQIYAFGTNVNDTLHWTLDGGNTWNSITISPLASQNCRIISPSKMFITLTNGFKELDLDTGTLTNLTNSGGYYASTWALPDTQIIYTAKSDGTIYKSTDGGITYTQISLAPSTSPFKVFYTHKENTLFFVTKNDLSVSHDDGNTWTTHTLPTAYPYSSIATYNTHIYGIDDFIVMRLGGLAGLPLTYYVSYDNGNTWEEQPSIANEPQITGGPIPSGVDQFHVTTTRNYKPRIVSKLREVLPYLRVESETTSSLFVPIQIHAQLQANASTTSNVGVHYYINDFSQISTQASVQADAEVITQIYSTIQAQSSVSADMTPLTLLECNIQTSATTTNAVLGVDGYLSSNIQSQASITSNVGIDGFISEATINATLSVTPPLDVFKELRADLPQPQFRLGGSSIFDANLYSSLKFHSDIQVNGGINSAPLRSADRLETYVFGTSQLNPPLNVNIQLGSDIQVQSSTSSSLSRNRGVVSNIPTQGSIQNTFSLRRDIESTIDATSTVDAELIYNIHSEIYANSSVSQPSLLATRYLDSNINASSSLQSTSLKVNRGIESNSFPNLFITNARVSNNVTLETSIDVTCDITNSQLDIEYRLFMDHVCASYMSASPLQTDWALFVDTQANASIDASITNDVSLLSDIQCISLLSSSLGNNVSLDCEPILPYSTLDANLELSGEMESIINATSTVSSPTLLNDYEFGNVTISAISNVSNTELYRRKNLYTTIVGKFDIDYSLLNLKVESGICLASTIEQSLSIDARLGFDVNVESSILASTNTDARLSIDLPVSSNIGSFGDVTGTVTNVEYLSSSITGTITPNTRIGVDRGIESQIDGNTIVDASTSYTEELCLNTSMGSVSSMRANVGTIYAITSTIDVNTNLSGNIKKDNGLNGSIQSLSSTIANVDDYTTLSSSIDVQSSMAITSMIRNMESNIGAYTTLTSDIDVGHVICNNVEMGAIVNCNATLGTNNGIKCDINSTLDVSSKLTNIVYFDSMINVGSNTSSDVDTVTQIKASINANSDVSLISDPQTHQLGSNIQAQGDTNVAFLQTNIFDASGKLIFKETESRRLIINKGGRRVIDVEAGYA